MIDTLNDIPCINLKGWLQKPYNCIKKRKEKEKKENFVIY